MFKLNIVRYFIAFLLIEGNRGDYKPNWRQTNWKENCGEGYSFRIIGGHVAIPGQFPWMARLVYHFAVDDDGKIVAHDRLKFVSPEKIRSYVDCAGALVSDQHVVTAAHCANKLEPGAVILGDFESEAEQNCHGYNCKDPIQMIEVEKTLKTGYDVNSLQNDIAVLKLKHPARLNDMVMPICLSMGQVQFGSTANVAGWGRTDWKSNDTSKMLNYVKVPILDLNECHKMFRTPLDAKTQLCAGGNKNEDTCLGDSGGPLMQMADGGYGPRYYLVGIVSYGHKKCGVAPAVYTRISGFMPFISQALNA